MKKLLALLAFVSAFLFSTQAFSCPDGSTCVPPEDMALFVKLLREKQCMQETKPEFKLDSVTIVTDQDGRVYFTGADPNPYRLQMEWCNYEVTAEGTLKVIVAKREPETWGFRFRPKFSASFLFADALEKYEPDNSYDPAQAVDVGILWDFLYWESLNLNVATGFRSAGLGVGLDLTKNFGVYGGYGFSWWTLKHNPQLGLYFGFW